MGSNKYVFIACSAVLRWRWASPLDTIKQSALTRQASQGKIHIKYAVIREQNITDTAKPITLSTLY